MIISRIHGMSLWIIDDDFKTFRNDGSLDDF